MLQPRTNDRPPADLLVRAAAEAATSRRARQVTILDLRGSTAFTDFFLICTATSDTHAEGIVDAVQENLEDADVKPWHREGVRGDRWLLLDYVDFVVHVFLADARQFYGLERLWAEASVTVLQDDEAEEEPDLQEAEADAPALTSYTAMDDAEDDIEAAEGHEDEE